LSRRLKRDCSLVAVVDATITQMLIFDRVECTYAIEFRHKRSKVGNNAFADEAIYLAQAFLADGSRDLIGKQGLIDFRSQLKLAASPAA